MLVPTYDRDNMDSGAMMRRAHERGERLDTYDPYQLVVDVRELLQRHGLHPELPAGTGRVGMANGAAGALLRALGILPAGGASSIDRLNAPDPDER